MFFLSKERDENKKLYFVLLVEMFGRKNFVVSKSIRAGLQFPVGKEISRIKKRFPGVKVSVSSGVYLTAVLEYMTAEILELAGNAADSDHKKRINCNHVALAVVGDQDLEDTFKHNFAVYGNKTNPHNLMKGKKFFKGYLSILEQNNYPWKGAPYLVNGVPDEKAKENYKNLGNLGNEIEEKTEIADDVDDDERSDYQDDYKAQESVYDFSSDEEDKKIDIREPIRKTQSKVLFVSQ